MNLLSDILTYIRRIIKTASNDQISDNLLIDYVNRFWTCDVDARIQLFDLRTKYQFQTTPGVDKYNMPLYNIQTQPGGQTINFYPVYQGFMEPAYINGAKVSFSMERSLFFNAWPNWVQNQLNVGTGDGVSTNYTLQIPIIGGQGSNNPPIQGLVRGHVDMAGIIATGVNIDPIFGTSPNLSIPSTSIEPAIWITTLDANNAPMVITDSGQFLSSNRNYGLLIQPGSAPFGNQALGGGYDVNTNTINYTTGALNVTFPSPVPAGNTISVQCYYFQSGLPRSILYYNNVITLRTVPDRAYLVELDAYLTPAAFLNTSQAVPYAYMTEYIARGAARKILSDTGDEEQLTFYEPFFKEQEMQVLRRSDRQKTATRVPTLYSQGYGGATANTWWGGIN